MPPGEFELIERYFTGRGAARADVRLSVGDDAAILAPRPGAELVLALDTIVSGVHFPADVNGRFVGHRALAVNLSDIAAMGAEPAGLFRMDLPAVDENWLGDFAYGLDELARRFGVALVGGDTTRGPLTASLAIAGWVPAGQALRRAGARPGDDLWVSGTVGDAGGGLAILQGQLAAGGAKREELLRRFLLPEPRSASARPCAASRLPASMYQMDWPVISASSAAPAQWEPGLKPRDCPARRLCLPSPARRLRCALRCRRETTTNCCGAHRPRPGA
jgi:thiamine-monophosphate kinase